MLLITVDAIFDPTAFRDGELTAVRATYDLLAPYARKHNVELSDLRKQLQKEYNVNIASVAIPAPEPTEGEIQVFDKIMKEYPPDDNKIYGRDAGPLALTDLISSMPSAPAPQPIVTDLGGGVREIKNHPIFGDCIVHEKSPRR